jgi:hypothetical protein
MQIQVPETARANPLALAAAGCVALAAASLALPSEPTFGDPWIWIVWGRETVEGSLNTVTGSSWKPLPVILIAPTSLLGDDLVADAWLVIARAGFLGAIVLVHAIASRMAGRIAGLLSAGLLALTPFVLDNALRGYSEGLCALAVLGALHRFRADRHGQAFALAFAAGLLRPEAWPFLGLYGLWLLWRSPRRLPWLAAGAALLAALWLLPEQWGSGDLWRASERAQDVGAASPSLAAFPALEIVKRAVGMLNAPGALAAIAAVALAAMSWARRGAAERVVGDDARRDAVALAVLGGAWTALVAVMTEAGYSGNERYLIVPMTLAYTLVGPGVAWTVKLAADRVPALRRAPAWAAAVLTLAAVAAYGARSVPGQLRTYDFEVATVQDLRTALARAGGPERLRACGVVDTHPMYRGLVAFELGLPMVEVGEEPEQRGAVLRTRFREGDAVVPAPLGGAETLRTGHWEVQLTCQRAVTDRHSTSDPG